MTIIGEVLFDLFLVLAILALIVYLLSTEHPGGSPS